MNRYQGRFEAIAVLLLGAGANPNFDVGRPFDVLSAAAYRGDLAMVELLLKNGADPNGNGEACPLVSGSGSANPDVVIALIEAGADVNLETTSGETALHFAAQSGSVEVVQYLLDQGANDRVTTASGAVPWDYALADEVRELLWRP